MNLHQLSQVTGNEAKAFEYVEGLRWPNGPHCPHCGSTDRINRLEGVKDKKGRERPGLWKCYHCRGQFTVRHGSIFTESPIPLGKWVLAIHLMCSSKKGISSNQLKRELGISYQSAWFLTHRIRLAMTQDPLRSLLGAGGGVVEVDETFIGGKVGNNKRKKYQGRGAVGKIPVLTLIERGGEARTFKAPNVKRSTLQAIVLPNVEVTANIMTDELASYCGLDKRFASHQTIDHSKEYVRGIVHTNFAESYHSLVKRAIIGAYHHLSEKHLSRYLAEFEFRWNSRKMTDGERTEKAIRSTEGKRLTYRPLVSH